MLLPCFSVIFTVFGLVAEIKVGVEVSIRMTSRMSQLVSACDVLVVAVTAGAGVYGAPRRMKKLLQFMEHIASVCIDKQLTKNISFGLLSAYFASADGVLKVVQ